MLSIDVSLNANGSIDVTDEGISIVVTGTAVKIISPIVVNVGCATGSNLILPILLIAKLYLSPKAPPSILVKPTIFNPN